MKKVMFISSTGGHLDELMQLKSMFKNYDYYIVTEKTKSNLSLAKKYKNRVNYLIYGSYTTTLNKFTYPFKLLLNTLKSLYLYIKINYNFLLNDRMVKLRLFHLQIYPYLKNILMHKRLPVRYFLIGAQQ